MPGRIEIGCGETRKLRISAEEGNYNWLRLIAAVVGGGSLSRAFNGEAYA